MTIVIYAKHLARVAAFYERVAGLTVTGRDPSFIVLSSEHAGVTVVQVPSDVAAGIQLSDPPEARTETPIKPVFTVDDLEAVRGVALASGGRLAPSDEAWAWHGFLHLDGVDPEGNVVQLRAPTDA